MSQTSACYLRICASPATSAGLKTQGLKPSRMLACRCLQACLDCYLLDSEKVRLPGSERKRVPEKVLVPVLRTLKIPAELWPLGVRLVCRSQMLQQERSEHLRDLLVTAVQVGSASCNFCDVLSCRP